MIVEQRDYHVVTGKLPELVRLYAEEGIAIQREVLGGFLGAFTTDVGALSTYTSLWGYESHAERESRRASLQARDDWQRFLARIQPLIHTQQNRLLGDVDGQPEPVGIRLGGPLGSLEVGDDDPRALCREAVRDRLSDPLCRARDARHLPLERAHGRFLRDRRERRRHEDAVLLGVDAVSYTHLTLPTTERV